jgi:hypothetical protein
LLYCLLLLPKQWWRKFFWDEPDSLESLQRRLGCIIALLECVQVGLRSDFASLWKTGYGVSLYRLLILQAPICVAIIFAQSHANKSELLFKKKTTCASISTFFLATRVSPKSLYKLSLHSSDHRLLLWRNPQFSLFFRFVNFVLELVS